MKTKLLLSYLIFGLIMVACATPQTTKTITERNAVLGERTADGNYYEARQISDIENWKDVPGKLVLLYVNFPPGSDNILTFQCRGTPVSSTESLEPNNGVPRYESSINSYYEYWLVPIDGVDVGTTEMPGRDGTFGEPVHFRQCLTVDNTYVDIPAYGVPYLVSSVPYTFAPNTVKRDFEAEARLLMAEQIIKNGGCVDPETLLEKACEK